MAPLDSSDGWQARCERWTALFLEDGAAAAPMRALMRDMATNAAKLRGLMARGEELGRYHTALVAQIDKVLARIRGERFFANHLLRQMSFNAEDLREAARMCCDEATASADLEMRHQLASRGLALAQLAEATARDGLQRW